MKRKIFSFGIIFSLLIVSILSILVFSNDEVISNAEQPEYSSQMELINSYEDFSYDYNDEELPTSYCMRDEYIIFAEQQSSSGLCWAFSSGEALSSTLMKATGEYLDFSEAWVSIALSYNVKHDNLKNYKYLTSSAYVPNASGWFWGFDMVAQNYGLMLEQDFEFENTFNVSLENVDYFYDMYSQYANLNFRNQVQGGNFKNYVGLSDAEIIKNSMKLHIKNNGAIAACMRYSGLSKMTYKEKTIYYKTPSVSTSNGHFLTFIGWDDDIKLTKNGKTYTGAWVALNSFSNEIYSSMGTDGIVYVFYDDTNFNNYFNGYKYIPEQTGDIYFSDKITSSTADCPSYLKGKYSGEFEVNQEDISTCQQNIFYQTNEVNLTYAYNISEFTQIDKVYIYNDKGEEVTLNFDLDVNQDPLVQTIDIQGSDVNCGSYKIEIHYSNQEQSGIHINSFIVRNGAEINCLRFGSNNSTTIVKNNGYYQLFNVFNVENEEIIYATSKAVDSIYVKFTFATHHAVNIVYFDGTGKSTNIKTYNYFWKDISINTSNKSEYEFEFVVSGQSAKKLKLKILTILPEEENDNLLTNVYYSDAGGVHSNSRKVVVNKTDGAVLSNPTKEGYNFEGWYYSRDFEESSKLATNENGEYILEYSKVLVEESPTVYATSLFNNYYKQLNNAFVYAKYSLKEDEPKKVNVSFDTNGGETIEPKNLEIGTAIEEPVVNREGYNHVGWQVNNENITFPYVVSEDTLIVAQWKLKEISSANLSAQLQQEVNKPFDIKLSYVHELEPDSISVTWYRNEEVIETTSADTLSQTISEANDYNYYGIIKFTVGEESVYCQSDKIIVEVQPDTEQISVKYQGDKTIKIFDRDMEGVNYDINIYLNDILIESSSSQSRLFEMIVEKPGKYKVGVIKTIEEQVLTEIFSEEIEIVELSFVVNAEEQENYQSLLLDKNSLIEQPISPEKMGYHFEGWQVNNENITFPYSISENTAFTAVWILKEIENIEVSSSCSKYKIEEPFIVNLTYNHELEFEEVNVEWFVNNKFYQETNNLQLELTMTQYGKIEIYAKLTVFDEGNSTFAESNKLTLSITYDLKQVEINYLGVGAWEIIDIDSYDSQYTLNFYLNDNLFDTRIETSKTFNMSIENFGIYKVGVIKSYKEESLEEKLSEGIEIVQLSFVVNEEQQENYPSLLLDKNSLIEQPISPEKLGYNFICWKEGEQKVDFPFAVEQNTILVATWEIKPLVVGALPNIERTYNQQSFSITARVGHDSVGGVYSYNWKKTEDDSFNYEGQVLNVKEVKDSGEYWCEISYRLDINVTTSTTNLFKIIINKAKTEILVDDIEKEYTYDGFEHEINYGAKVNRTEQLPQIQYSNNSFKNVPQEGGITMTITAMETDNYLGSTKQVYIKINKATSEITGEENQIFEYNGNFVIPEYYLDNDEQTVVVSSKPTDVGDYFVEVTALESENYKKSSVIFKVIINPAKLVVKINNAESSWLFEDLKEFSYEIIEGKLFNDDTLNEEYICQADKSKGGKYVISMKTNNSNYQVEVRNGEYIVNSNGALIVIVVSSVIACGVALIFMLKSTKRKRQVK